MAGYMDRALKAKDPRFARILGKIGYDRRDMVAADEADGAPADDLTALRAEYQEAVGKKAYHGWSAEEIRSRIAQAVDQKE